MQKLIYRGLDVVQAARRLRVEQVGDPLKIALRPAPDTPHQRHDRRAQGEGDGPAYQRGEQPVLD